MTGFSEKTMRNPLPLGVQIIDDDIGIAFVTGCEDNYFKILAQFSKAFDCVRSNIYASLDASLVWELYLDSHIMGHLQRLVTVDQGLVQVED